jgi:hypothetical protein
MWCINSKRLTLQQVLIMAYMNALEARSCARIPGDKRVQVSCGELSFGRMMKENACCEVI